MGIVSTLLLGLSTVALIALAICIVGVWLALLPVKSLIETEKLVLDKIKMERG